MTSYIKSLKDEGYTSLKDEYYKNLNSFPTLGKPIEPNGQDPDLIDREDQTNNADDDDETKVEKSTAEDISNECSILATSSWSPLPSYNPLRDHTMTSSQRVRAKARARRGGRAASSRSGSRSRSE